MTGLLTGLINKFNTTNSLNTALSGRMYLGVAPQEITFPFAVYNLITDTHDYQFVEQFEDVIIQFDIVSQSSSATECNTLFGYLISLYDNCSLTISGYSHIRMDRLYSNLNYSVEDNTWTYTVQYRILIQKS